MLTHNDYIKHRLNSMMSAEHTLSEWGVFIIMLQATSKWRCCDLCDAQDVWKISRHLVSFPNGREKSVRMVVITCPECGNTKTVALKAIMQNEKLRMVEAFDAQEPTILEMFRQWRDPQLNDAMPEIMRQP